jgi:ribosomal protein S18 acetylase RimI-like enzyme
MQLSFALLMTNALVTVALSAMEPVMKYEVRRASLQDAKVLEKFMQSLIGENLPVLYSKVAAPTLDEIISFIEVHSHPNVSLLIVVIDKGRLIGMLDADIHRNPQRSHCASFGMSVLNDYRRDGVGSSLLTELFQWAKKNQLKRIELEVFSNNLAAIGLYKKMGFLVEGVKKEAVRVSVGYVDIVQVVRLVA